MNIRQLKYKANRIAGMNQYNAARSAGYSESMARKHPDKLERAVKVGIADALEQVGITDKYQAQKLFELTSNDDAGVQLNALKHVADLKSQIKDRVEHSGKIGGGTTVNVYPHKTTVFTGIDEIRNGKTQSPEIYATESESGSRIGSYTPGS